ncbi:MAG TPA: hypothetical protein VK629_15775, partial [Steroidobacteraceae bacterium]|nr:hypothetical protein [Steroidobacteraceae bacterium]
PTCFVRAAVTPHEKVPARCCWSVSSPMEERAASPRLLEMCPTAFVVSNFIVGQRAASPNPAPPYGL